jgi:hypothetical protein
MDNVDLDFDPDGNWHAVYSVDYPNGSNAIRYLSSTAGTPVTISEAGTGENYGEAAIQVDINCGSHVMYTAYKQL